MTVRVEGLFILPLFSPYSEVNTSVSLIHNCSFHCVLQRVFSYVSSLILYCSSHVFLVVFVLMNGFVGMTQTVCH
jgi:hypothetical protein